MKPGICGQPARFFGRIARQASTKPQYPFCEGCVPGNKSFISDRPATAKEKCAVVN